MKIANENQLLATIATALPPVRRALAFAPHPDDEIFGCGGTLALMQAAGVEVQVHILTDGALGGDSDDDTLVARREGESCAAARILGLAAPQFWRLPDRGLSYGEPLVTKLREAIAGADADLVLLPAVTELHPDHQTLALAGAEALRRLGGQRQAAFYEIGNALASPNLLIDISAVAGRKQQAMEAFVSQLALQPYAERISGLNRYRAHLLAGDAHSAEAFLLTTAQELAEGFGKLFEGAVAYRRRLGYAADPGDLPLVSVIVRSMDRDSLDTALESIACQTYSHIEVIVVNAKGEEHRPLGDHCGCFPLRMVGDGSPLPRSKAANTGLHEARGDYLIFLDDDDWFYPHHIDALVVSLSGNDDAVAVYSAVLLVDGKGKELEVVGEEFDLIRLYLHNFIPIHALMFRKKTLKSGARFDETIQLCEDWDFWINISQYGKFIFNDNIGAVYVINNKYGSGVRVDYEKTNSETIKIYRKWIKEWDDASLFSIAVFARSKMTIDKYEVMLRESGFSGTCFEQYIKNAKKYKVSYEKLYEELSGLRQRYHNINQEYENIKQVYHDVVLANENITQAYHGVMQENENIKQVYHSVMLENESIKQVYHDAVQENENIKQVYHDVVLANEEIKQVYHSVMLENENIKQKHFTVTLENENINKVSNELRDELEIIRKENNGIITSNSWKVTYPLRYFGQVFKKTNK